MEISISNTDIIQVDADLLVLKHADDFYGADAAAASAVGFEEFIREDDFRFVLGKNIGAREVLFIGVGPLNRFRYPQIQTFGARALSLARTHDNLVKHMALTIHGPGYGLDPEQALLSLVAGIVSEWNAESSPLQRVTIVERSPTRCKLLNRVLQENREAFDLQPGRQLSSVSTADRIRIQASKRTEDNLTHFGERVEGKAKLFIAMPFSEEFTDEFEIGFLESAKANSYICERLDVVTFVGDILAEIKNRILSSDAVIALLNGHNPNVFLEIGFAWANGKPTILVAKDDTALPFDVRGHRCIRYKNIKSLRDMLTAEIAELKSQGLLGSNNS